MGTGSGTILSSPEPKSSSKRMMWALVIILLLAVLLGVYFWTRKETQPVQKAQTPVAPAVVPAPPPPEPIKDTIHFAFQKSTLVAAEQAKVKAFWEKVSSRPGQITLEGHTCSLGSDWYNQRLSERRAERVAKLLAAPDGYAVKVPGLWKDQADRRQQHRGRASGQPPRRDRVHTYSLSRRV